jgi:hypothetical protein
MLVKNEKDIIECSLRDALRWIDKMFILDNGSDDGTWEILNRMAKENDKIVPWKQDFTPYRRIMRTEIFNEFRNCASDGDWWYWADSDEFLVDDPREFLAKVPKKNHVVFKKSIDYFLTPEDIKEWEFTGDFEIDREHIKYFTEHCWAEIRFFRHRSRLDWAAQDEKPAHIGIWHPTPILIRHYQFRSPTQMQRRLDIRNKIPKDAEGRPFRHVKETRWEQLLKDRNDLVLDAGVEQYRSLPMQRSLREPFLEHIAKRFLHGTGILP